MWKRIQLAGCQSQSWLQEPIGEIRCRVLSRWRACFFHSALRDIHRHCLWILSFNCFVSILMILPIINGHLRKLVDSSISAPLKLILGFLTSRTLLLCSRAGWAQQLHRCAFILRWLLSNWLEVLLQSDLLHS